MFIVNNDYECSYYVKVDRGYVPSRKYYLKNHFPAP